MSTEPQTPRAAQPKARKVRIEEIDGDLELSYRQISWGVAAFLIVWLTGWTTGCVLLVSQVITKPSVEHILFTFPFLSSWFFVFAVLLAILFGVERVRLGPEGLEYQAICLIPLYRRWVPREELKGVSADLTTYQVNERNLPCLKFETLGQAVQFAGGISAEEQHWLAEWLNEYLHIFCPQVLTAEDDANRRDGRTTDHREILQPAATPVEPPSDTRIEGRHHLDGVEFVWRGGWNLAAIAAMTFVTLFWNGVLSIFVCQVVQEFNWFLFFFLIPHEIIGLCIFGLWLTTLTAPLWRLTWTVGEREATRRLSISDANAVVFDLGWSKRVDLQPPLRTELRRRAGDKNSGSLWPMLSHPDGDYTLVFLSGEEKEFLRIDRLTEGDARWIADVLLDAFPSWRRIEKREWAAV